MTVVTVINYKGGVGKTTLTANLGAELAYRGRRVLLIDLDPQASLTFSHYQPNEWERTLADERTILQWFGSLLAPGPPEPLASYVLTPPAVNEVIGANSTGRLDLIASHLGLVEVDLDFAYLLGGSRFQHGSPNFLRVYRALRDALADDAFREYDIVLIDCAPNFTMVTRTGIVASDYLLVPARPDHLSTLGIDYLRRKLTEFIRDYNKVVTSVDEEINPVILGVVFNMVQYIGSEPIAAQRPFFEGLVEIEATIFNQRIRDNKTLFGPSGATGIPAVLVEGGNENVKHELRELASEFLAKIKV